MVEERAKATPSESAAWPIETTREGLPVAHPALAASDVLRREDLSAVYAAEGARAAGTEFGSIHCR